MAPNDARTRIKTYLFAYSFFALVRARLVRIWQHHVPHARMQPACARKICDYHCDASNARSCRPRTPHKHESCTGLHKYVGNSPSRTLASTIVMRLVLLHDEIGRHGDDRSNLFEFRSPAMRPLRLRCDAHPRCIVAWSRRLTLRPAGCWNETNDGVHTVPQTSTMQNR